MKKIFCTFYVNAVLLLIMNAVLHRVSPSFDNYVKGELKNLSPVLKIEFTRDTTVIKQMFSFQEPEKNIKLKNEIILANSLDFIYMILYSLYMYLFVRILAKKYSHQFFFILFYLPILAFIFDFSENLLTFKILQNLSGDFSFYLYYEWLFSITKWIIISLFFVLTIAFVAVDFFSILFLLFSLIVLLLGIYAIFFHHKLLSLYVFLVSLDFFAALFYVVFLHIRKDGYRRKKI